MKSCSAVGSLGADPSAPHRGRFAADASISAMGDAFDALIVRIVGRPHGVYWLDDDGRREVGPFPSLQHALRDMTAAAAQAPR